MWSCCSLLKGAYNYERTGMLGFAMAALFFTTTGAGIGCLSGKTAVGAAWGLGCFVGLFILSSLLPAVQS